MRKYDELGDVSPSEPTPPSDPYINPVDVDALDREEAAKRKRLYRNLLIAAAIVVALIIIF